MIDNQTYNSERKWTWIWIVSIIFLDKFFYAIGGYSKCSAFGTVSLPCLNDIGFSNRIWKFEPDDPQPSVEGYDGKFVEITYEPGCAHCRLKYGLTDVTAIILPQYSMNELNRIFKGQ